MKISNERIKELTSTSLEDIISQHSGPYGSIDTQLRAVTEARDEMLKALDQINSNGKGGDREIKWNNALSSKIRLFDSHIEKAKSEAQRDAKNAVPYHEGFGGNPLDKDGKVRMYNASQKIAHDYPAPEGQGVNLGQYLRALVDKPRTHAERQIIQNSTTSGDYELPTWIASEFIDLLRAANPLLMEGGAGARTVSLDGGLTKYVRITADPTAVWHAEMTDETPSDPTFDSVDFDPKTVLALTEVSRELLQDSMNIEEVLTAAFVGSLNDAILDATFGTTTTNGPTGLGTTVTQTEEYTNGGSPDWGTFVGASGTLHTKNVPEGNRSFLFSPDVWETLALIQDTNNRYQDAPQFIRNVPNFTSSGVPTGVGYAGDFSNVVYGYRLNISIEQHPSYSASKYGSLWVAVIRMDLGVFRPSALVRIEEAAV